MIDLVKVGDRVGYLEDGKTKVAEVVQLLCDAFLVDLGECLWYLRFDEVVPPF